MPTNSSEAEQRALSEAINEVPTIEKDSTNVLIIYTGGSYSIHSFIMLNRNYWNEKNGQGI